MDYQIRGGSNRIRNADRTPAILWAQQCRRLGYPPRAAARAKAAALARKCHELLGLAGIALDPQKTVLEQAALEIGVELVFHVPRQRSPFGRPPIPKPGIVLRHQRSHAACSG